MRTLVGTMLVVITIILMGGVMVGCASTKIAPDGKGNYQAIMESTTVLGLGTDYAERVNGSMQVNAAGQKALDEAVQKYGGGAVK